MSHAMPIPAAAPVLSEERLSRLGEEVGDTVSVGAVIDVEPLDVGAVELESVGFAAVDVSKSDL